jgi:hypothetical protein
MMNEACCGFGPAISQRLGERIHGQLASHVPAQLPADALSAGKMQDNREVNMLMQQLDICDIRSPDLVQSSDLGAL